MKPNKSKILESNQFIKEEKKYNSLEELNKDLDELQKLLNSYVNQYHKK